MKILNKLMSILSMYIICILLSLAGLFVFDYEFTCIRFMEFYILLQEKKFGDKRDIFHFFFFKRILRFKSNFSNELLVKLVISLRDRRADLMVRSSAPNQTRLLNILRYITL